MRSDYGSSPLTRGTQTSSVLFQFCVRFIPAYAGNSQKTPSRLRSLSVHPRLRGELPHPLCIPKVVPGSSPLTRGTLLRAWNHGQTMSVHPRLRGELFMNSCVPFTDARFIPAYAGNSSRLIMSTSSESVHPRLRGELIGTENDVQIGNGSSPLTRGTHAFLFDQQYRRWFIPAYAGNSSSPLLISAGTYGSSPLTRGTLSKPTKKPLN